METETLVPVGGRMQFSPSEIILLESDINYTRLHFADGTIVLTSTNLGKLESRFSSHNFFRTNRQHMVNLNYVVISQLDSQCYLRLPNDQEICVSRRKKDSFIKTFNQTL
jgi:DNA-binding LytR/AlgR family response regulator